MSGKIAINQIKLGFAALKSDINGIKDPEKREFVSAMVSKVAESVDSPEYNESAAGAFVESCGSDGMLGFEDFAEIAYTLLQPTFEEPPTVKKMKKLFQSFDSDGNSRIDASEFQMFLQYVALVTVAAAAEEAGVAFDMQEHNLPAPPPKITPRMIQEGFEKLKVVLDSIPDPDKKDVMKEVVCKVAEHFQSDEYIDGAALAFAERCGPDGTLTFPEFVDLVIPIVAEMTDTAPSAAQLKRLFDGFDLDGNDRLDPSEYKIFLGYVALQMCTTSAKEIGIAYDGMVKSLGLPEPEKPKVTSELIQQGFEELISEISNIPDPEKKLLVLETTQLVAHQFSDAKFKHGVTRVFLQKCNEQGMLPFNAFVDLAIGFLLPTFDEPPTQKQMKRMFDSFDKDSNGFVDAEEFSVFLGYVSLTMCAKNAQEVGAEFDAEKLGLPCNETKITDEKVEEAFSMLMEAIGQVQDEKKRSLIMNLVDKVASQFRSQEYKIGAALAFSEVCEEDGTLSFPEFVGLIIPMMDQVYNEPLSVEQLRLMFDNFDVDGNDKIDVEEYKTFLSYVALQVCAMSAMQAGISLNLRTTAIAGTLHEVMEMGTRAPVSLELVEAGFQRLLEDIECIPDPEKREMVLTAASRIRNQFCSPQFKYAATQVFKSKCGPDGMLDFDVFVEMAIGFMLPAMDVPPSTKRMKQLFDTFDLDGNGRVDAEEFQMFLSYVALIMSAAAADKAGVIFDSEAFGLPAPPKKITEEKVDLGFQRMQQAILSMHDGPKKNHIKAVVEKASAKVLSPEYREGAARAFAAKCSGDKSELTFPEFVRLIVPMFKEINDNQPLTVAELQSIFDGFDIDGNGKIDAEEYKILLGYVALQVCAKAAQKAGMRFSAAFTQTVLEVEPKHLPPTSESILNTLNNMSSESLRVIGTKALEILAARAS